MSADGNRVRFGIKTSQSGLSYDEIQRIWREADAIPVFEDAWLWDHLVPLRGEVTGTGVRATLVSPGAVDTSLWDAIEPHQRHRFPSSDAMLRAEDVADAILYAVTRPARVAIGEIRLAKS